MKNLFQNKKLTYQEKVLLPMLILNLQMLKKIILNRKKQNTKEKELMQVEDQETFTIHQVK
jgi:hypothetical protein